jgi:urease accessory protein
MQRALTVRAGGSWQGKPADCVVLGYDDRYRRRMMMTGVAGTEFLLDLAEAVALRGGDALVLEDGRLIEVIGAPEPLAEIKPLDGNHAMQIAWHLGNRHLPVQFVGMRIRIRRDTVIEDMLEGLGAKVIIIDAPFDPEGGAYAKAPHAHGAHDHHHAEHVQADHVHGPGCRHGHSS